MIEENVLPLTNGQSAPLTTDASVVHTGSTLTASGPVFGTVKLCPPESDCRCNKDFWLVAFIKWLIGLFQ